jgi:hypothetical protein
MNIWMKRSSFPVVVNACAVLDGVYLAARGIGVGCWIWVITIVPAVGRMRRYWNA